MNSPTYYICGTPSDKRGFQFTTNNGPVLPGKPGTYLDRVPSEALKSGDYRRIERVSLQNLTYTCLTWYKAIEPNDTVNNRGAYIGVGCITPTPINPAESLAIAAKINLIQYYLSSLRDENNRFPDDFSLEEIPWHRFSENDFILRDAETLFVATLGSEAFNNQPLVELYADEFSEKDGTTFFKYGRLWRKSEKNNVFLAHKIEQVSEEKEILQRVIKDTPSTTCPPTQTKKKTNKNSQPILVLSTGLILVLAIAVVLKFLPNNLVNRSFISSTSHDYNRHNHVRNSGQLSNTTPIVSPNQIQIFSDVIPKKNPDDTVNDDSPSGIEKTESMNIVEKRQRLISRSNDN